MTRRLLRVKDGLLYGERSFLVLTSWTESVCQDHRNQQ